MNDKLLGEQGLRALLSAINNKFKNISFNKLVDKPFEDSSRIISTIPLNCNVLEKELNLDGSNIEGYWIIEDNAPEEGFVWTISGSEEAGSYRIMCTKKASGSLCYDANLWKDSTYYPPVYTWKFKVGVNSPSQTFSANLIRKQGGLKKLDEKYLPDFVKPSQLQEEIVNILAEAKESGEFNGDDGTTPHIGENGNWYIGEEDTGISASGEVDAETVETSVTNYFIKNPLPKSIVDIEEIFSDRTSSLLIKFNDGSHTTVTNYMDTNIEGYHPIYRASSAEEIDQIASDRADNFLTGNFYIINPSDTFTYSTDEVQANHFTVSKNGLYLVEPWIDTNNGVARMYLLKSTTFTSASRVFVYWDEAINNMRYDLLPDDFSLTTHKIIPVTMTSTIESYIGTEDAPHIEKPNEIVFLANYHTQVIMFKGTSNYLLPKQVLKISYNDKGEFESFETISETIPNTDANKEHLIHSWIDADGNQLYHIVSDGKDGTDGKGISNVEFNEDGKLVITFTDDTTKEFELSNNVVMPTIEIGTVSTLSSSAQATAELVETEGGYTLNLGIPKGAKGTAGETINNIIGENWEQISYQLNGNGEAEWSSDTDAYSKLCVYILTGNNTHGKSGMTLRAYLQTNSGSDLDIAHAHTLSSTSGKFVGFRFESELKGFLTTKSVGFAGESLELARSASSNDIVEGVAPLGIQTPIKKFKIGLYNNDTPISLSGHYVFGVKKI